MISPNNRCRNHLEGEESEALFLFTCHSFKINLTCRRKSNCVRQTCETASTIRTRRITTLLLPGASSSFTSPPPAGPQFQNHRKFSAQCTQWYHYTLALTTLSLPTSAPASPLMMGQYELKKKRGVSCLFLPNSHPNSNVNNNTAAYKFALGRDIPRRIPY